MKELPLGEAIRRRREELGLTQEDICEGICTPATLSRLENSKQTPSYNRIKALLQRLNMPDDRYYALLTDQEEAIRTARKEILSAVTRFSRADQDRKGAERQKALELLQGLEKLADEDDAITRQFILGRRASLGREEGPYPFEERLSMLLEALRLTIPNFDLEKLGRRRYTVDETRLINQIAGAYSDDGQQDRALDLYRQLYAYVSEHDGQLSNYAPHFTMIAYNYARELTLSRSYPDAIRVAEEGKRVSINYASYKFLPGFLALLGECYYLIGLKEESRTYCVQAHYLYKVLDNEYDLQFIDPDIKERFHIEFWD